MKLRFLPCVASISLAAMANPVFAQQQQRQFDVQFSITKCDCAARKAEVQVQLRASDAQKTFRLGDANFRFEYDADKLNRAVLLRQDGFSPRSGDMNYNLQHINGSSEGTTVGMVSLNTTYSGGAEGATLIGTDWKGVATMQFDLTQLEQPISLRWHNDQQFPVTGMNAVKTKTTNGIFDYDLQDVTAGRFTNVTFTPAVRCRNVMPALEVKTIYVLKDGTAREIFNIIDPDVDDTHQISPLVSSIGNVTDLATDLRVVRLGYSAKQAFLGRDKIEANLCDNRGLCNKAIIPVRVVEDLPPSSLTLDLQALAVGKQARLNWLNNSGPINERFVVQKQLTNGAFVDLTQFDGFSTKADVKAFVKFDENPSDGENSYRIKLELADGTTRFSEVKKVKFSKTAADMNLYPNPADSYTELDLTGFKGQHAKLEIFDEKGALVEQRELGLIGNNTFQINVSDLSPAAYVVRIKLAESKNEIQKTMVIMR